ncbi:EAL domain-containing protein [Vogesella sp. GCM10023246]|uniref:EAL domain-containing protein n=1 Tax=Vogesella oryzagri TaxID=3160864 RepID=A0ABV1M8C1_9NEIS
MWLSFESRLLAAISAAVLVVAALSLTIWKVADDATRSAQWVSHSHELLHLLARTRGYTLQIELTSQGFRLKGDPAYLQERDEAIASRENSLQSIRRLITDNPQQLQRWEQLRQVIRQRLAIARQVEHLRKTQGMQAANAYVAQAPLQQTRVRAYRLLSEMDTEERRLLALRDSAYGAARQTLVRAGTLVGGMLVLLLVATYVLVRRQMRATEENRRALADSEESLATTLHSIGDAVLATDTVGRITRMNEVAEQLTGWSQAQAIGQPVQAVFRIVNEQTREPAVEPVAAVLASGRTQALANHTALIARDGSECPIADSAAPIRDTGGELRGVVLVFRDVSAERRAEQTIREQNVLLASHVRERTAQWHASEDHLRSVIGTVPALIAYVNAERRYVYVNEQYRQRFAPEVVDIAGCTVAEILGAERYAIACPLIDKVLQGVPQSYDWQPFADVWQNIRYVPKPGADGQIAGYYVLGTDITARKQSEEQIVSLNTELGLRVRELEHVSRALRTLSAGNRAMLRASDEQQLLDSMCQAIVQAGGYSMAVIWYLQDGNSMQLRPMAHEGYPGGLDALRALGLRVDDSERSQSVSPSAIRSGEVQLVRDMQLDPHHAPWRDRLSGPTSGLACPLRVGGRIIGALTIYDAVADTFDADEIALLTESSEDLAFGIATLRTQAEQEQTRATMHHMMRYDALTGLPNVLQFEEVLSAAITACAQSGQQLATLQFNIERLGEINDALGFIYGDQILCDFGTRLQSSVPAPALVARVRGDEFAILLPGSDAAAALAIVDDIEQNLLRPFPVADIALDVTARAGIALFPDHGTTPHNLLRRMDKAVHQAKKQGLSHVIFDPGQAHAQAERLIMVGELRRAIEGGELRLYLQPKVAFDSGRVCGAEALVRWQHPRRGLLFPGAFIALAEQTGLIRPLTEWVISAALDQLQRWQAQGCAVPIAVNLSARNLRDEGLQDKIRQWQAVRELPAGWLELEITESSVMEDPELALNLLHALRADGIPLYIDDFGTGYSSLSYLQKLPVDYIKIDQSFVAKMSSSHDSAMIVRSTIDLVRDLGRKTVAEGVESLAHWQQLSALGCDFAQGYFIAKPMPAEVFQDWVASYTPPDAAPNAAADAAN